MWAEAAKTIAGFPSGAVVTAIDAEGYPVSLRVTAPRYDARTGELPIPWPDTLTVTAGPALVLCHSHNRKLWNIKLAQVKGRLETRAGGCIFVSTAFTRPFGLASGLWHMVKSNRVAGTRYLEKRGLPPPVVNWDSIRRLRRRAKQKR